MDNVRVPIALVAGVLALLLDAGAGVVLYDVYFQQAAWVGVDGALYAFGGLGVGAMVTGGLALALGLMAAREEAADRGRGAVMAATGMGGVALLGLLAWVPIAAMWIVAQATPV